MKTMLDDLGTAICLAGPARRIVSLVPSLTEAVAVSTPGLLVGATQWCTHPADLDVLRVGGPKNPSIPKIRSLKPDIIIANEEENRKDDVERMRSAGLNVWVTKMDDVDQTITSLQRLFTGPLGLSQNPTWLAQAEEIWTRPARLTGIRVAVPIWRDPWIWVGGNTYADDVLRRMSWTNVGASIGPRYPQAEIDDLLAVPRGADVILLPDEPYAFSTEDGPEAFPDSVQVIPVSGRALFWYGPAMIEAHKVLDSLL